MLLKNAVAVLTGAGRLNGVGAASAKLLAQQGCNVVINCLKSQDQAEQVAQECRKYKVDAEVYMGDVTQSQTCREMAKFVSSRWKRADILINCLGVTKAAPYEKLEKLNEDDFAKLFAVNVTAPYLVTQAFQGLLKASGDGVVINVSSAAGITGKGSSIAYAAAKGAENTLSLALAQALSPEVRVNAVCPSFIDSSWGEESFKNKEDGYKALIKSMQESNLLKKVLTPADVAFTILSIIQNPMITGELIRLDGGAHIGKANPRDEKEKDSNFALRK
jgi:3-oxoacyl-[acyl-carrier protein] reductase